MKIYTVVVCLGWGTDDTFAELVVSFKDYESAQIYADLANNREKDLEKAFLDAKCKNPESLKLINEFLHNYYDVYAGQFGWASFGVEETELLDL